MTAAPGPLIPVMEVLAQIGWVPAPEVTVTESPAFKFNFGNFELVATTFTNFYLQPVVNFEGLYGDGRTVAQILFEVPERIESRAQVLAWLAFGIGQQIPLAITPSWLEEGRQTQHRLPWERQRAAYNERPQASVDRDWMRVLGKRLAADALLARDTDTCRVHFDGTALRFHLPDKTLPVPATGREAWLVGVIVSLPHLRRLPARWMQDPVEVSYWDGCLRMANCGFNATIEPAAPAASAPVQK